jgi:hypothetical protein
VYQHLCRRTNSNSSSQPSVSTPSTLDSIRPRLHSIKFIQRVVLRVVLMADISKVPLMLQSSPTRTVSRDVSPSDYLLLSPVKRSIETALYLPDLPYSISSSKRFRLEPEENDDNVIMTDYSRMTKRDDVQVATQFDEAFESLWNGRDVSLPLRTKNSN